jgi:hypothetical protein
VLQIRFHSIPKHSTAYKQHSPLRYVLENAIALESGLQSAPFVQTGIGTLENRQFEYAGLVAKFQVSLCYACFALIHGHSIPISKNSTACVVAGLTWALLLISIVLCGASIASLNKRHLTTLCWALPISITIAGSAAALRHPHSGLHRYFILSLSVLSSKFHSICRSFSACFAMVSESHSC